MNQFPFFIKSRKAQLPGLIFSSAYRLLAIIMIYSAMAVLTEAAPLPVFPEEATGWEITYSPIAEEDFSSPVHILGPMAEVGESGFLETDAPLRGQASLAGRSDGTKSYRHYFNSRPEVLPLKNGKAYRLTLTYRILEAGDKGFEVMFYSPSGGKAGKWLDGITLGGPAGTSGIAVLERTLYDYPDYRVWLNVIGKGAIVVDDIKLSEGGKTIFEENFEGLSLGPGPGIRLLGGSVDSEGRLILDSGARIETNPDIFILQKLSEFRLSFDYLILEPTIDDRNLDIRLLPSPGSEATVSLRPLLRNSPASGHFSTGFGTGSAGPYLVSISAGRNARILIDNIVIERGRPESFVAEPAAYKYLGQAPFPRLGNYNMISATEQVAWGGYEGIAWNSSVEKEEKRLALFDVIFGFTPLRELYDSDLPNRIKKLNPNAVLLPYVIGQETIAVTHTRRLESPDPYGDPGFRYDLGLSPEWLVKDTKGVPVNDLDYPGILKLDISPSATLVGGHSFLDYQLESYRRDYHGSGIWDGLFIDNLFARMNSHIPNAFNPEKLDYDINRNGKRDETPAMLNRISYDAERRLLERLIKGIGNRELIMGNNGPLPETRLAPYVNGYVFENYNLAWDDSVVGGRGLSEPGWKRAFDAYLIMDERCRSPRINVIEAWGRIENFDVMTKGRINPTPEDFLRNRFALGTALLGNAFYEYDLTEARSSIFWFDEYTVGTDGIARESADGKGYLGRPLGLAKELVTPGVRRWDEDFEGLRVSARGGGEGSRVSRKTDEVITGKQSMVIEGKVRNSDSWPTYETWGSPLKLRKGTTYLIEFSWRVLEDLDYLPSFAILSPGDQSGTQIDALYSGEEGLCRYPFTPLADAEYILRFSICSVGIIAIDDIRVSEGGVGPWRRDFENGFVLVNPYRKPVHFDEATLKGIFERTGIKRIKGSQTPQVNSGLPVTGGLELGPFDAIILLADPLVTR
jgi:hypothetical protein